MTESSARTPREIGDQFTAAQMNAAGLPDGAPGGVYLAQEYKTDHNGVTHLVYRQRFQGIDIHGMEWRVNIDQDGRVLNAGGQLFAAPNAKPPSGDGLLSAARAAVAAVNPVLANSANLRRAGMTARGEARFVADDMGETIGRAVWYPVGGVLQPAWNFVVTDGDGISLYDTVIEASSEAVIAKRALTMFQTAPRGSVFTGISPQPPVKFGVASTEEPPYVSRTVVPFTGAAPASPRGWVSGTETAGNNTVTGYNPAGTRFLANPITAKSATRDFQFPLELGPGAPVTTAFTDAVTTNLFYWVNRAHDMFYDIGFNEAAGNYQAQNLSGYGLGGDPMLAYSQFGSQALTGFASLNNAFFTTLDTSDGGQGMIAMYLTSNGGVWADGSLATDVILHEYTHGVTARLIPTMNFGFQGGAMNEALSDFWAREFLIPEGAPIDGVYPDAEYWSRSFGVGLRAHPASTNMEVNPLTYADLGHSIYYPEIHEDGVIWVSALWDIRANLIRQFGETEGRRRLRRIIIDGMKMAPPSPSMVDLRDSILLAERVDFKAESQTQLWEAFAKRGLGALAYSPSSNTIQVTPSYDKPSNTGIIGVQTQQPYIGEPLRITVFDGNYTGPSMAVDVTASSGDIETILLDRTGSAYSGTLFTTTAGPARKNSGSLSLIPGDSITVYYNDADTGAGAKQIEKTIAASPSYAAYFETVPVPFSFPGESTTAMRASPGGLGYRITLPFDFPFYGKKYRELRAFPEGYVQFDTALTPACLDEKNFAAVTGIAPMAGWMRTNGIAQPGENIYTSRGPNSFTIRWAGETVPTVSAPPYTAPAEPVNFALRLFENGQIAFFYGTGNQNLINRGTSAGCQGTAPFVGISRGIGNAALPHVYGYERVNFKDAPQIGFFPPYEGSTIPVATLDAPAQDAKAQGVLTVRGTVYDRDVFVTGVYTLIDGVYMGAATRGQSRPDVCTTPTTLPGCPNIGFVQNIDLKANGIKPGTHTIQVRAVNGKGGFKDYPESPVTFTVEDGDGPLPVGGFTALKDGDTWKGTVLINGFAYSKTARVTAVDLMIDGIAYGRTAYSLSNAELCRGAAAGSPNCPGVAWLTVVDTEASVPALANGKHQVQIRITEESGRTSLQPDVPVSVTVDNVKNQMPKGVLTAPTNLERVSGTIMVSGHAWDPDGRVLQAIIVVDGASRTLLRYGLPRPEACAALPDVKACPNIGFEGTFDTKVLSNGVHSFAIGLIDDNFNAILIPSVTSLGMNIIVDNK